MWLPIPKTISTKNFLLSPEAAIHKTFSWFFQNKKIDHEKIIHIVVTANNIEQPGEQITSYLFQFAEPANSNDLAIEEIIVPSKLPNYNRYNPAGFNPQIKIRNLGKENLKSLQVIYKTAGFEEKKYTWNGNFPFYGSAIITLPGEIFGKTGTNVFSVVLAYPNGADDEWAGDNKMETEFEDIPTLPSKIVIDFLTNKKPNYNSLFVVNSLNDTVFMKSPDALEPETHYSDTLGLPEGNYFLMLTDSVGDGLEFWFQPNSGFGRLQLKDASGKLIHIFESDCGNGQFYGFRASNNAVVDTTKQLLAVNIYPRMVRDYLSVYTSTNKTSNLKIRITKDGEYIETHEFTNIMQTTTGLDLKHLSEGRYVMEIFIDGEHKMNRRFNKL